MKRGYFGIGVYHPKTEENIGTLWREANLFGANFLFTIGRRYNHQRSDTMRTPKHIPLFELGSIDQFEKWIPRDTWKICIELTRKARPLPNFVHPERAVYILGAEDYGLPKRLLNNAQSVVKIPQVNSVCSSNVAVAGSIVLYDRFVKGM